MPEGPSIVILKEQVQMFKGKRILDVSGNSKTELHRLKGQKVVDFKSWGKHFLICFKDFTVRIHLMLFGSYRINETKEKPAPRLSLKFANGEINFYSCSVKIIEGKLDGFYDWEVDTMSDKCNAGKALHAVKGLADTMVCDVLLNQNIFAGSGNIIKNEVLFRIKVHPGSKIKALPKRKLTELVKAVRIYCFEFYEWKKKFELRKHWKVYRKKICPECTGPITLKVVGVTKRRTFYCNNCQILYK